MKAVTLKQPFASLVAVGAKTLLDRAGPTGYRGRLLIHAGTDTGEIHRLMRGDGDPHGNVEAMLASYGYALDVASAVGPPWQPLPLGVVVASCVLVDCVPVVEAFSWLDLQARCSTVSLAGGGLTFHRWGDPSTYENIDDQRPFGDFSPGRFVWLLDDVKPTTERCPRCWWDSRQILPPEIINYNPPPPCPTCNDTGSCSPVPLRGHPGLWTPEWEA